MILGQIDALPTLPAVATRLLELTSRDDAEAGQVVQLISGDPALTAKVLAMCRTSDKGLRGDVVTLDKAVVMLGFSAVRSAVLSLKVFEVFDDIEADADGGEGAGSSAALDREAFWRHCIAVACAAEAIAGAHRQHRDLDPGEAFVAGLLHDIGKLALDHVLPKAYRRVVEMAAQTCEPIAMCERRVLGLDHATAGKRLAEQWHLPHRLLDCIWLHGQPLRAVPDLPHRRLVGLIGLADAVARRAHLGCSGNLAPPLDPLAMAEPLGLDISKIEAVAAGLHERVAARTRAMGIGDAPTQALLYASISQANQALGRLNHQLSRQGRSANSHGLALAAIDRFHAGGRVGEEEADIPPPAATGRSVAETLDAVTASASDLLGVPPLALLVPIRPISSSLDESHNVWLLHEYGRDGRLIHARVLEAPLSVPTAGEIDGGIADATSLHVWVVEQMVPPPNLATLRFTPLRCGWGMAGVLLHEGESRLDAASLASVAGVWGSAIAAATQHEGARRLGERLAEANAELVEAQARLLHHQSMARLGEMAAGAAHEMNNPLTVIAGQAQLLATSFSAAPKEQRAARTIVDEAQKLSDLISCLHLFAQPPRPEPRPTDLADVLNRTIRRVQARMSRSSATGGRVELFLKVRHELPPMMLDAAQTERVLREVLLNAVQADPKSTIQVTATLDASRRRVTVQVIDDGGGMDPYTLEHAADPFFSKRTAGRRVGMGLPCALQLLRSCGGTLDLQSQPGKGTTATITLPVVHVPQLKNGRPSDRTLLAGATA